MNTAEGNIQLISIDDRGIHTEHVFVAPRETVWRAFTDPALLAKWWGRGNPVDVEALDVERGGHWRFVEHAPEGTEGFEGRYREVTPIERLSQTFEWDGMPGHVSVTTTQFEDIDGTRTRVTTDSQFMTAEERDAMLAEGMEDGLARSYAALHALLDSLQGERVAYEPLHDA